MTVAERSGPETPSERGTLTVTAYVEWDESVRLYVGSVLGIPGAHTQGATLDELRDVIELLAEEGMIERDGIPCFVGLQQLKAAV